MDIPSIALAVSAANFFLNWGIGFYVHLVSKNKVTNDRITKLENDFDTRMDGQGERIARLEEQMRTVPTHDDLSKLYDKVNATANMVSSIAGELKVVNDNLRMILNRVAEKGLQ